MLNKNVSTTSTNKANDNKTNECCICTNPIDVHPNGWADGHNAEPVEDGRCCSDCNMLVVIPHRIALLNQVQNQEEYMESMGLLIGSLGIKKGERNGE